MNKKELDYLDLLHKHKFESPQIGNKSVLCVPESCECSRLVCKYIQRLFNRVQTEISYIEVGVKYGRTFSYVLEYCKNHHIPIKAYAIDLFEDFEIKFENTHKGDVANSKMFKEKLDDMGYDNVTVLKGDSVECIKRLDKMEFALGFIDANHTYEAVKSDYNELRQKIGSGFIVLDDINRQWVGVHQFYNELPRNIKAETLQTVGVIRKD